MASAFITRKDKAEPEAPVATAEYDNDVEGVGFYPAAPRG